MILALKSFSRVDHQATKIEARLCDGIEMVLTIYQGQLKHGTEVVREYEEIAPLLCLPDELNQVWTNLIHNALQAMNHEGTLTLGIRRVGEEAVVSVSDTGSGIPEEIRDKIFNVFFTTKPTGEGSGLGLDIVKKIVEKHQGRIDFKSEIGVGTTFFVYLPYATR
jgi:signal transduction histidine kinase